MDNLIAFIICCVVIVLYFDVPLILLRKKSVTDLKDKYVIPYIIGFIFLLVLSCFLWKYTVMIVCGGILVLCSYFFHSDDFTMTLVCGNMGIAFMCLGMVFFTYNYELPYPNDSDVKDGKAYIDTVYTISTANNDTSIEYMYKWYPFDVKTTEEMEDIQIQMDTNKTIPEIQRAIILDDIITHPEKYSERDVESAYKIKEIVDSIFPIISIEETGVK